MNDTNEQKNHLAYNLATLRKQQRLTLEQVAERIGVTRQAVAKWETGESMPDLINCDALATLYNVSLDDLVHFDQEATGSDRNRRAAEGQTPFRHGADR